MDVLKLPSVAWISNFEESICFKSSLVDVFPFVPVIPITGILNCDLHSVAIFPIALIVSPTSIWNPLIAGIIFETIAQQAPFLNTSSKNSLPSTLSPLIAIYRSPFWISLLSVDIPLISWLISLPVAFSKTRENVLEFGIFILIKISQWFQYQNIPPSIHWYLGSFLYPYQVQQECLYF